MAPRYRRKTSFGGIPVEPEQTYVQPTIPSVTLADDEVKAIKAEMIGNTAVLSPNTAVERPKPVLSYRDVLGLSRENVADIFWRPVSGKVKRRILGNPAALQGQFQDMKARLKELKELMTTRNRRWQKYHRPEDMLTTAELQRLLREEKREWQQVRKEARELARRLRNWGASDEDYVGETEVWVDMLFQEKHPNIILSETTEVFGWVPFVETKRVRNANGGYDIVEFTEECAGALKHESDSRYSLENYYKLIRLEQPLSGGMTWENWTKWENATILVAITEGLIKPDVETVSQHPDLNRWTVPPYDQDDDHDEERKLILKTGGASLGGASIYARGWRYGKNSGATHRALESFDATARIRRSDSEADFEGFSDAGSPVGWGSDDAESYDAR